MSENEHLTKIQGLADEIDGGADPWGRCGDIIAHANALVSDLERMAAYARALEHDYASERETMYTTKAEAITEIRAEHGVDDLMPSPE